MHIFCSKAGDFSDLMTLYRFWQEEKMVAEGIPREGYPVLAAEQEIGFITSGTFSPSLNKGIALSLLDRPVAIGEDVFVEIRGKNCPATVVKLPFWRHK